MWNQKPIQKLFCEETVEQKRLFKEINLQIINKKLALTHLNQLCIVMLWRFQIFHPLLNILKQNSFFRL